MIKSYAVDVEIFPNLFSVTFVDLKDYLDTFKDCVDDKGKPLPLSSVLSVKEIISRLDNVKSKVFYISDTNDSQLLELFKFISETAPYYITDVSSDGIVKQKAIRYDLYGFNNSGYDDYMIKAFLMYFDKYDNTKELINKLYKLNKKLIELQSDKHSFFNDKEIDLIHSFKAPYTTVDLQRVFALHAAGVNIDKDSGARIKYGKSLKQTSINLKWHELLDFKLPPIDEEEFELYWSKLPNTKHLSLEELNVMITNDFDRYVLPKYVDDMLHYNKNDVFVCCEIVRQKPDEVRLRYSLSNAFNLNLYCCSRANIADKFLVKFYSEMSGLKPFNFKKLRTERNRFAFSKVIFPHISFKTKQLQYLLKELKDITIYSIGKDAFSKVVEFYGTTYTLATGGIHSVDKPGVYKSDDKYTYVHWDYTSFYPSIIISYNIAPKHLNEQVFVKMVDYFKTTRVACKHTPDSEKLIIDGVPNKLSAEALKIVINAIYGKFGSQEFWLYDRLAQLKVTINGQLMTMSLVEDLELEGIHVISANTDGIIIKLPNDKKDIFNRITSEWNKKHKMSADGEEYDILVTRDVNNYFNIQKTKDKEFKGALDPKQYIKDLKKGYNAPIVAKAVVDWFIDGTPVMTTLRNATDILDFCMTQNVGKQFEVVYAMVDNGEIKYINSQRHVRFYVCNKGVNIFKEHNITKIKTKLAGGKLVHILNTLDDELIENRNINYEYYYKECYKIIDPIMLKISPSSKGDRHKRIDSGRILIKKHSHQYSSLFDDDQDYSIIQ